MTAQLAMRGWSLTPTPRDGTHPHAARSARPCAQTTIWGNMFEWELGRCCRFDQSMWTSTRWHDASSQQRSPVNLSSAACSVSRRSIASLGLPWTMQHGQRHPTRSCSELKLQGTSSAWPRRLFPGNARCAMRLTSPQPPLPPTQNESSATFSWPAVNHISRVGSRHMRISRPSQLSQPFMAVVSDGC